MSKQPANPFQAHIVTEHGGTQFKRAKTLEEAITKAQNEKDIIVPGGVIRITQRWVQDTKGNILWKA